MNYLAWAVIAMVSYGITAVLLKIAFRQYPPEVSVVIANTMLVVAAVIAVIYRGQGIASYFGWSWATVALVVAGITLSISIISFYTALHRGPASTVVPIFALNFAVASVLGVLLLGEEIKLTKIAGFAMAVGAVFLLTR
ncbi:MAG: multidrug transporter [SAR202 cluster bacterium]|nr:multidrug transporter [SAR202 cluster bacterium]